MSIAEKIARAKADLDEVYAAGKKAEWSEFWDALQSNGNRDSYGYAFARYEDNMFYPKYDIKPTAGNAIFTYANVINLKQRLIDCGVELDFSAATTLNSAFLRCYALTHLPILNTTSASDIAYLIADCTELVEVDKLILKADGNQTLTGLLGYCAKLENITIEGVIGNNGINMRWSAKLSKASITSVINALSTTTTGLTVTFSQTAVNNAFGGSTSAEWLALVATRSNWTIALA